MASPQYKLTYFDIRGLGEVIRLIFAHAKVSYEDVRLPLGSLTDEKKLELNLPWGQLPTLEINGVKYAQSVAIARYLSRKFKLAGQDEFEELKCDEIVDAFRDYGNKWTPLFPLLMNNGDPAKIKELLTNLVEVETPKDLPRFNKILEASSCGWFVGKNITWTDIFIYHFITQLESVCQCKLTTNFPALQKLIQNVENSSGIKEWIAKRPQTKA